MGNGGHGGLGEHWDSIYVYVAQVIGVWDKGDIGDMGNIGILYMCV